MVRPSSSTPSEEPSEEARARGRKRGRTQGRMPAAGRRGGRALGGEGSCGNGGSRVERARRPVVQGHGTRWRSEMGDGGRFRSSGEIRALCRGDGAGVKTGEISAGCAGGPVDADSDADVDADINMGCGEREGDSHRVQEG